MNNTEIINEIIAVVLKYNLTFGEMKELLMEARYAIDNIQVPENALFKHKDGTLSDKV